MRFVSSGAAGSKRRLQRGHLTFLPAGTDLTTLSRAPHSGHTSRMFVMTGNDILSPLSPTYLCVTQMVLVRLAERMRTFADDPSKSVRGWPRTLT